MAHLPRLIIDHPLYCPHCGARHVDESRNGEKWHRRAHTTHRCQSCGKDFDVYVSGEAPPEEPVAMVPRPASGGFVTVQKIPLMPKIVVVKLDKKDAAKALEVLRSDYVLPDGTEIVDARSVRQHSKTLEAGFYERLEWPEGSTAEDISRWFDRAMAIVEMHKRGLL